MSPDPAMTLRVTFAFLAWQVAIRSHFTPAPGVFFTTSAMNGHDVRYQLEN